MTTLGRRWGLIAALLLAGRVALADGPKPGTAGVPGGVKLVANIEYAKNDHKPLLLDLYLPDKASGRPDKPPEKAKDLLPVVLWVHGGGWIGGAKTPCPAVPFVARGYAVASVEYRLSGEAPFPAQIEDVKAAVRWIRANAKERGLDPDRIGAWGASAGGHLVGLLGTSADAKDLEGEGGNAGQSSRVRAIVDFCGPTDFLQFDGHGSTIVAAAPGSLMETLFGGPLAQKKDLAVKANPITYVTKDDPPFLIFHGDKDNVVPFNQSELLTAALKKAGVDVTLETVRGAGHAFGNPVIEKTVEDFFDKNVKNAKKEKPSAPPPSTGGATPAPDGGK